MLMLWIWLEVAEAGETRLLTGRVESVRDAGDGTYEVRVDRGSRDGVSWQGRPYRVYRIVDGRAVEVGEAGATGKSASSTPARVHPNEGIAPAVGDLVVMPARFEAASPGVAFDLAAGGVDLRVGGRSLAWEKVRARPERASDAAVCTSVPVCLALRWYAETGAEALLVGPQEVQALVDAWRAAGEPMAPSDAARRLAEGARPGDHLDYAEAFAARAWDGIASGDAEAATFWADAGERLATATGSPRDRALALLTTARSRMVQGDNDGALAALQEADGLWPEGRAVLLADAGMAHVFNGDPWAAGYAFDLVVKDGDPGMRWGFVGDAMLDLGRTGEARDAFERCSRWHVEHPDTYSTLRYGRCQRGLAAALVELGELDEVEFPLARAWTIAEVFDMPVARGDATLTMAELATARGQTDAVQFYEGAAWHYEQAGRPAQAAGARLEMAELGWRMTGNAELVVQVLDEALRAAREAGDDWHTARALLLLGEVRRGLDDPHAALAIYEEALAIAADRWPVLRNDVLLGVAEARRAKGDEAGARAAYDEVAGDARSPHLQARALHARGMAYGDPADVEAAAEAFLASKDPESAVFAFADLAELRRAAGDLPGADAAIERAKEYGRDLPRTSPWLATRMARIERDRGDLARAIELSEAGINDLVLMNDFDKLFAGSEAWFTTVLVARELDRALELTERAAGDVDVFAASGKWAEADATYATLRAEALLRLGRVAEAERIGLDGARTALEAEDREAEVRAYVLLSEIALHRGDAHAALVRAERAAKLLALAPRASVATRVDAAAALSAARLAAGDEPGAVLAAEGAVSAATSPTRRVQALTARGLARLAAGDRGGAEADLVAAVEGSDERVWPLHRDRAALALAELRLADRDASAAAAALAKVTVTGPRPASQPDATVRWAKQVGEARVAALAGEGSAPRVAEVQQSARQGGAWLWVARAAAVADPALDPWHEALRLAPPLPEATGTFRDVLAGLEAAVLDLADRMAVPAGELEALQADLRPNEAVVVPVVLPDRVGLVVVRSGQPIAWREEAVDEATVDEHVRQLRAAVQAPSSAFTRGVRVAATASAAPDPSSSASALYDLLVRPALADLAGVDTLVFAPSGRVRYVPFAALDDGERFLAETHTVALLTASGSTAKHRPLDRTGALLAMSNPDGSLPGATAEVQAIAGIWGAKRTRVHDGAAVTEDQLRTDLPDVRLLHLATHGVLLGDEPRESYLLFAAPGGGEGRLTLREITLLPLDRIDLAVLSACETAVGDLGTGQEIAGLAYQLEARGAAAIVASLWPVDDASTSVMMTVLYGELAKGTPRAQALRAAQLAVLADPERRHPYYWAPFVVVGDWR